jgi:hypothetical protein
LALENEEDGMQGVADEYFAGYESGRSDGQSEYVPND